MTSMIATKRLYLRQWQASDRARCRDECDPKVMAYFPKLLTPALSNTIANKCQKLIEEHGWGFWVVARKDGADKSDDFIGMVGLNNAHADMPFAPAVEIGWRLHKDYWGLGYATEARVQRWILRLPSWHLRTWCHLRRSSISARSLCSVLV